MSAPINNPQTHGSCVYCDRKCHQQCERCGDSYCSVNCQRNDWQRHRYYCLPMPRLVARGAVVPDDMATLSGDLNDMKLLDNNSKPEGYRNNNDKRRLTALSPNNTQYSENEAKGNKVTVTEPGLPKSGSQVYLMSFRSSNRCFARSYSAESDIEYKNTIEKIHEFGKTAPKLRVPKKDNYAIAFNSGKYKRVKILKILENPKKINVAFCDWGYTNLCDPDMMRAISDEIKALPIQVFLLELNNVEYIPMDQINKRLSKFIDQPYVVKYSKTKFVELFYPQTGKSLNQEISKCLLAPSNLNNKQSSPIRRDSDVSHNESNTQEAINLVPAPKVDTNKETKSLPSIDISEEKPNNEMSSSSVQQPTIQPIQKTLAEPFKLIPWTESTGVEAIVMDTSGLENGFVGCLLTKDALKTQTVLNYLAEYEPEEKPYRPTCGEFVLAKYDGGWYRAKVMDVDCDAISVYYVDFTNEATVHVNDIRAYPRDGDSALYTDCCTVLCCLDGLSTAGMELPLQKNQVDTLKAGILRDSVKLLIDEVKKEKESVVPIVCPNVIKELKNLG